MMEVGTQNDRFVDELFGGSEGDASSGEEGAPERLSPRAGSQQRYEALVEAMRNGESLVERQHEIEHLKRVAGESTSRFPLLDEITAAYEAQEKLTSDVKTMVETHRERTAQLEAIYRRLEDDLVAGHGVSDSRMHLPAEVSEQLGLREGTWNVEELRIQSARRVSDHIRDSLRDDLMKRWAEGSDLWSGTLKKLQGQCSRLDELLSRRLPTSHRSAFTLAEAREGAQALQDAAEKLLVAFSDPELDTDVRYRAANEAVMNVTQGLTSGDLAVLLPREVHASFKSLLGRRGFWSWADFIARIDERLGGLAIWEARDDWNSVCTAELTSLRSVESDLKSLESSLQALDDAIRGITAHRVDWTSLGLGHDVFRNVREHTDDLVETWKLLETDESETTTLMEELSDRLSQQKTALRRAQQLMGRLRLPSDTRTVNQVKEWLAQAKQQATTLFETLGDDNGAERALHMLDVSRQDVSTRAAQSQLPKSIIELTEIETPWSDLRTAARKSGPMWLESIVAALERQVESASDWRSFCAGWNSEIPSQRAPVAVYLASRSPHYLQHALTCLMTSIRTSSPLREHRPEMLQIFGRRIRDWTRFLEAVQAYQSIVTSPVLAEADANEWELDTLVRLHRQLRHLRFPDMQDAWPEALHADGRTLEAELEAAHAKALAALDARILITVAVHLNPDQGFPPMWRMSSTDGDEAGGSAVLETRWQNAWVACDALYDSLKTTALLKAQLKKDPRLGLFSIAGMPLSPSAGARSGHKIQGASDWTPEAIRQACEDTTSALRQLWPEQSSLDTYVGKLDRQLTRVSLDPVKLGLQAPEGTSAERSATAGAQMERILSFAKMKLEGAFESAATDSIRGLDTFEVLTHDAAWLVAEIEASSLELPRKVHALATEVFGSARHTSALNVKISALREAWTEGDQEAIVDQVVHLWDLGRQVSSRRRDGYVLEDWKHRHFGWTLEALRRYLNALFDASRDEKQAAWGQVLSKRVSPHDPPENLASTVAAVTWFGIHREAPTPFLDHLWKLAGA
ncbi:MAG: hypothetical protein ACQEXJ_21110 [Myxococcota bacterium]